MYFGERRGCHALVIELQDLFAYCFQLTFEFSLEGVILDGNLRTAHRAACGALVPVLGDGAIDELGSSIGLSAEQLRRRADR